MPVNMKRMIADTFVDLSRTRSLDKITVKHLVEACGISRQSFYYHFQDIMEVIEWIVEQAMQDTLRKSLAARDPQAAMTVLIGTLAAHWQEVERLLHSQRREEVERILHATFLDYVRAYAHARAGECGATPPPAHALHFCAYGIVGVVREALEAGVCDEKVLGRELIALIYRMMPGEQTGGDA